MAPPPSSTPVFPDDLLLEIFSRLPHAASAIRCSSVCHHWFSLIHQLNHPNPFHGGDDYSHRTYPRPYTLLFKFERSMTRTFTSSDYVSGVYDLLDPTDDVLYTPYGPSHFRNSTHFLDFIPWQLRLSHVAACVGDFLLLKDSHGRLLSVCNLVTRNCSPISYDCFPLYGLAWDCNRRDQYRVVGVEPECSFGDDEGDDEYKFTMAIFSIDTGGWRNVRPKVPRALTPLGYMSIDCYTSAVACVGGFLYFPTGSFYDDDRKITGILGIDAFSNEGEELVPTRFIPLPAFFPDNELRTKSCFGLVRGRLRLSHSRLFNPMGVINLRIWELNDDGEAPVPWFLIHHVHLALEGVGRMLVPALHPNNGDVLFVLRDNDICSYNLRLNKYHKIGEIPYIQEPQHVKDQMYLYLNVFTLLH